MSALISVTAIIPPSRSANTRRAISRERTVEADTPTPC